MYYPYFRGKQYELITIRENAQRLADSKFIPIIEPVKEGLSGLERALDAVVTANGNAIVIVNPYHGDHSGDGDSISLLLREKFLPRDEIAAGILLKPDMHLNELLGCIDEHIDHDLTVIHAGYGQGRALAAALADRNLSVRHVFIDDGRADQLYRRHFRTGIRILVRDGFRKQKRNQDYPPLEPFSDLHVIYEDNGMDGFGDFLTVGDEYQEGGGPAYAIAIHLTFIDHDDDDRMWVYHFKSERSETPTDAPGKFAEALSAMIRTLDLANSKILETDAVAEFRSLHRRGHFPGLGKIKQLSMEHHIETLSDYFK
jgi:hypothetical protein